MIKFRRCGSLVYSGEIEGNENKNLRIKDIKVFAVLAVILSILLSASYIGKAMLEGDHSVNEINISSVFAHHGKRTYFSYGRMAMDLREITGAFYTFSENDTVPIKFSDEVGNQIKVKDNWLYFISAKDGGGLYRIKTDGTGKMRLTDESAGVYDLKLFGNHLYFKDSYNGYNLCRIKLDGSSKETISDDVLSFYIQGERIYYFSGSKLGSLYEMNEDGSDSKKVAEVDGSISYINDNFIYYNKIDSEVLKTNNLSQTQQYYKLNDGPLYRIRKDGTEKQLIIDDKIVYIYVRGNQIYYKPLTETMNTESYTVDLNGKHKTKLPLDGSFLGILDKWIYYLNLEEHEIYRTTLDFRKIQKIETDLFKPTLGEE